MIDHLHRSEAYRQDMAQQERISTDPEWVRQQMGKHQYSRTFCICMAIIGALAFSAAFIAIGSI
jgi:hypothetical protein